MSSLIPIPQTCPFLGGRRGLTEWLSRSSSSLTDWPLDSSTISGTTIPTPSWNRQTSQPILAFAFLCASMWYRCSHSHLWRPTTKCQGKLSMMWKRPENQRWPKPCSLAADCNTCAEHAVGVQSGCKWKMKRDLRLFLTLQMMDHWQQQNGTASCHCSNTVFTEL